jgi:hypothetical protein
MTALVEDWHGKVVFLGVRSEHMLMCNADWKSGIICILVWVCNYVVLHRLSGDDCILPHRELMEVLFPTSELDQQEECEERPIRQC